MKIKTYSQLRVREKITTDLNYIAERLKFYAEHGTTELNEYAIADLNRRKALLLEQAAHYDREKAAGYLHPVTKRWGKKQ